MKNRFLINLAFIGLLATVACVVFYFQSASAFGKPKQPMNHIRIKPKLKIGKCSKTVLNASRANRALLRKSKRNFKKMSKQMKQIRRMIRTMQMRQQSKRR